MLRNRQIEGHKFVRQLPIGPYFADFACREAALVVELDGGRHLDSTTDEKRTAHLNAEGYSVLRLWNNDVLQNPQGVAEAVLAALNGHLSPGPRFAPAAVTLLGRGTNGIRAATAKLRSNSAPRSPGRLEEAGDATER